MGVWSFRLTCPKFQFEIRNFCLGRKAFHKLCIHADKDKLERSCFCLLPAEITVTKLFEFSKSVMPPCKRGGAVGERAQEFVEHCTNTAICGLGKPATTNDWQML